MGGLRQQDSKPDVPGFEEFYKQNRSKAYWWLLNKYQGNLTGGEAEEIVAEAACELLKRYEKIEYPKPYFYRTLDSYALEYLKGKLREKATIDLLEWRLKLPPVRDRSIAYQSDDLLDAVKSVLTNREMDFIRLVYITAAPDRDKPYNLQELAKRWNYSYDYMRQYASKVFRKLRRHLLNRASDR